jgi:hypothetical protein
VNTDKGDRFGLRRLADDLIDLEIRRSRWQPHAIIQRRKHSRDVGEAQQP